MRILAIDTTAEFGSLALWEDGTVVEEIQLHAPEGFSGVLFDQVRHLLKRHNWDLGEIDVFAAAAGPGSFTGVRVGLAAVKGLAHATGKAAAGVSNLRALAALGPGPRRAAVIDARRNEVYAGLYDAELHLIGAETVGPFRGWLENLPDEEIGFISPDLSAFRSSLADTRFADAPVLDGQRSLAAAVAWVASRNGPRDPAAIDANYVRRSDAELFWKDPAR